MILLDSVFAVLGTVMSGVGLEIFEMRFMQAALLGLLLLAPMTAMLGVQVVNLRMGFFADAISHSALTGVAMGLLFSLHPHWSMPLFAVFMAVLMLNIQKRSSLSSDTVIGVSLSAMVALGLMVVSRDQQVARNIQTYLLGDILTIEDGELLAMFVLLVLISVFQVFRFNHVLYLGLNHTLAKAHRVKVRTLEYALSAMIAVVVIFAVWAVGVLLVTAMLVVPAAAARNFSRSSGAMFWWSILISISSAVLGLVLSTLPAVQAATGAVVILCTSAWFFISLFFVRSRARKD